MKKTKLTKSGLYSLFTTLFCCALIVSNTMAGKTFALGPIMLPCAVIVFPVVYIVNDVMAEIYGFKKARAAIFTGFAMNLLATLFYLAGLALPAGDPAIGAAFSVVLGSTPRMLLASFTAYIFGSLLNSYIMTRMKNSGSQHLMLRCILSTLCGEGLDAIIFISIAFYGVLPLPVLGTMILSQAIFKTAYEIVVYPVTRAIIRKVEKLHD